MSAGLAGVTVTPRRDSARPGARRSTLQLVPAPRTSAPRTRFVALVASLLVTGLIGLLLLNTTLARDAFALYSLSTEARTLAESEQALQREVELLRSPQNLATRATELGMVQAGPPAFLRLSDGAVLGATDPAAAPPTAAKPAPPVVKPAPATKPTPAVVKPSSATATKPSPVAVKPSPAAAKPSPAAVKPSAVTKPTAKATPAPGATR